MVLSLTFEVLADLANFLEQGTPKSMSPSDSTQPLNH